MSVWTQEGLLDPATAERLKARYPAPESRSSHILTVLLATGGCLLIAGGFILLIAHNWDSIGRPVRAALSILPSLLAFSLAFFVLRRRQDSTAWREAAGTFCMFAAGASMALVGQTYHLPANEYAYFLSWTLLTLLVMYPLASGIAFLGFHILILC